MEQNDAKKLFEDNQKLVNYVLWHYYSQYGFDEDLYQEGSIGLWKACLTYKESRSEFSTYAVNCIRNQILKVLQSQSRKTIDTISLDAPLKLGFESDLTIADCLEDPVSNIDIDYICLRDHLSKCKEKDKRLVQMRLQGLTLEEISQTLGVTKQYVGSRLTKILVSYLEKKNLYI